MRQNHWFKIECSMTLNWLLTEHQSKYLVNVTNKQVRFNEFWSD